MISAILRVVLLCGFGLGLRIGVHAMLRNLSCWNPNVDLMVSTVLRFLLDSLFALSCSEFSSRQCHVEVTKPFIHISVLCH
jgi:hypothetical protein